MEIQDKEIFREDEIFIRDMVICIKFAKKASVLSCARQEERTLCIHTFLRDRNDDNNVGVYVRGETEITEIGSIVSQKLYKSQRKRAIPVKKNRIEVLPLFPPPPSVLFTFFFYSSLFFLRFSLPFSLSSACR